MTLFDPLATGDGEPRPTHAEGMLHMVTEHPYFGIDKWNTRAITPWMVGRDPDERRDWVRETIDADHAGTIGRPIRFHPDSDGIVP